MIGSAGRYQFAAWIVKGRFPFRGAQSPGKRPFIFNMERMCYMEERQFRNQVCWVTFLFSILVIWVHSFNAELFLGATETAARVNRLEGILGNGLGQIAVPGFFMVSSYLFYRNFKWAKLACKWKSRIRTILVPYLLWNFLYYAGYGAATRLPAIQGLIGKPPVPFNLESLLDALVNYTYNPVFWYLYQLILLIVLAPVIYAVFRNTVAGGAALGLMVFALWKGWDFPCLNMDALFYYCTAAYISLHRTAWGGFAEKRPNRRQLLLGTGVLAVLLVFLVLGGRPGSPLFASPLLTVLVRLWGVCAAWFLLGSICLPPAGEWMKHNFFLYAIHFAWVRLFNKLGARLLPAQPAAALVTYLLMPLLMVLMSTLLVKALNSTLPRLYRLLAGGR